MPTKNEELFYNHPVQVLYWEDYKYKEGIAYQDTLIDVETGEAMYINKVVSLAKQADIHPLDDDILIELSWVSLKESFDKGLNDLSFRIRERKGIAK